jgi:pimeloyl-ACP methyl ester carboxylesterase
MKEENAKTESGQKNIIQLIRGIFIKDEKAKAAPRQKNIIYFKNNPEVDFWLQCYALGYQVYGGSTVGEVFYAASKIQANKPETWTKEFRSLAERVESEAIESLNNGHEISARDAFLRAVTYYRCASLSLSYKDPSFRETYSKMKECFMNAAKLFNPEIEIIEIPYEGKKLPAYFMKPAGSIDSKRPTLILIGGGETFVEDLYFWGGAAGVSRGYNVLLIDFPGQGATAFDGLHYRYDTEVVMKIVVDYLLERPDVVPEKIVTYGVSLGGYIITRAVAYEKRIRACAASTPLVDWHQYMVDYIPEPFKSNPGLLMGATSVLAKFLNPAEAIAVEKFFIWQVGVNSYKESMDSFKTWNVDVSIIECPMLCIVGEGENDSFKKQTKMCYDGLKGKKKLRVMTMEEGADAHCQANNLPLAHREVFDFFDEVIK